MNKKNIYEEKYTLESLTPSPYFRKQFKYIEEKYIKKNNLKILDLGGGTGEYSLLLESLGHKVTLFDFSEQAIKRAKEIGIQSTICDNFLTFNFAKEKYDIIFVKGFSLLNTDDSDEFLSLKKQMQSILKEDGYIIYMGQTDLSGKWTKGGWFQLNHQMVKSYFDEYLILPAFRYQLYLPLIFNKFISRILSKFSILPWSFTLVGISQ